MNKISQREAHRLHRRVLDLEHQRNQWNSSWLHDYPGGTHIASTIPSEVLLAKIAVARRLGHSVIVTTMNNELRFYAAKVND